MQKLPMYQRVGASAYKKDLSNINALCAYLGHPEKNITCVHIAGTNGKGSVTHILGSIFQEAGYKTGYYTSPHYVDFRERIKINGQYISENEVIDFVDYIKPCIEKVQPSFFEISFAMSLYYFAKQQIDVAMIETGLGGRLDSTNIVQPILSIITNIGLEHQAYLGNSLTEIAGEKAGIIKENTPVLIGQRQEEVYPVFEKKAKEVDATLFIADEIVNVMDWDSKSEGKSSTHFSMQIEGKKHDLETDILGRYQMDNIQTAVAASVLLDKQYSLLTSMDVALQQIRKNTRFMGRFSIIKKEPAVILDSAHNKDGLSILLDEIKEMTYSNLHVVFGTVSDKELHDVWSVFPAETHFYFCKPDVPRGRDVWSLKKEAAAHHREGKLFDTVKEAYLYAIQSADKEDVVLVCGSVFVVAEVIESSW